MGEGSLLQVFHGEVVIRHRGGLGDFLHGHGDIVGHFSGHGNFLGLALVDALVRLVFQDVDHAAVAGAVADGQQDGHHAVAKALAQLGLDLHKVGMIAVHLVDDEHLAHVVLGGIVPRLFRAHGDAADGADQNRGGFHHAQGAHHLAHEIKIAGHVDDVEHLLVPVNRRNGRADGDFSLDLLRVVVGNGVAVLDTTLAVDRSGSEQQCLHQRGFSFAAMSHEGDVADVLGLIACHYGSPLFYLIFASLRAALRLSERNVARAICSITRSMHMNRIPNVNDYSRNRRKRKA